MWREFHRFWWTMSEQVENTQLSWHENQFPSHRSATLAFDSICPPAQMQPVVGLSYPRPCHWCSNTVPCIVSQPLRASYSPVGMQRPEWTSRQRSHHNSHGQTKSCAIVDEIQLLFRRSTSERPEHQMNMKLTVIQVAEPTVLEADNRKWHAIRAAMPMPSMRLHLPLLLFYSL